MLAGDADTINVPKGAYTLSAQFGELLLVSDPQHIVGAGARDVFIDGAHETRLMRARRRLLDRRGRHAPQRQRPG